jgi:hypothetical protein
MLIDLVDADLALQSLFDHHDPKDGKLIEAFDQINSRQGSASINFVTAGQSVGRHTASAYRSQGYTTEWNDTPVMKT